MAKSKKSQKSLRQALENTINISKQLNKNCIKTLNPVMNKVILCKDFEDTYLSREFETLKVACAKYKKAVENISEEQERGKTFVESVKESSLFLFSDGSVANGPIGCGGCSTVIVPFGNKEIAKF